MLKNIQIKNFALIDNISIDFAHHINAITGETGAGKSIIIGALQFLLGSKLSASQKKDPSKPIIIEGVFDPPALLRQDPEVNSYLEDDDYIIISRTMDTDGKTKATINGSFAPSSKLKLLGNLFVDFHGQHDHQFLLRESNHLSLLDQLAKTSKLIREYTPIFLSWKELTQKKLKFDELEKSREREIDILKNEISEISEAHLENFDEDRCDQEIIRLESASEIKELTDRLLDNLKGSQSASEKVENSFSILHKLDKIDAQSSREISECLEKSQIEIENTIQTITDYAFSIVANPDRLSMLKQQVDLFYTLKRKYGHTKDDILKYLDRSREKHDLITNIKGEKKNLDKEIKKIEAELKASSKKLTFLRKKMASKLEKTIEKELQDLGISNAKFKIKFTKKTPSETGEDRIEFLFNANIEGDLKPLSDVISGGEASRLMLALKKSFVDVDPLPLLIFDEIDANIGGRLAGVVGKKLKEISKERQIILITHLPQIASQAKRHIRIKKTHKNGKTFVRHDVLEDSERIKELAQMMSGKNETAISKKHAKEMLKTSF